MLSSSLCDAPRFVAGLEDVYRQLWTRFLSKCQGDARAALEGEFEPSSGNCEVAVADCSLVPAEGKPLSTAQGDATQEQQQDAGGVESGPEQDGGGSSTSSQSHEGGPGAAAGPGQDRIESCSSRNSRNGSPGNTSNAGEASLKGVRQKRAATGDSA